LNQENSEVSTRQLQAVCLEINCLVEHLDRALLDKDLTYVEVIQAGRKELLPNWEELLKEQLDLENELGTISAAIGYVKGHCTISPFLYEGLVYVLKILRHAITEFEIPTTHYSDLHIEQFINSVEQDIHDAAPSSTNWVSQDFADIRIGNLRNLSMQLKSLINEESEKQEGEALVDYLLEKNYFQELLWPELVQFGIVNFSWHDYPDPPAWTLYLGVKNTHLPFLASHGNIVKHQFLEIEKLNHTDPFHRQFELNSPPIPDWIEFDISASVGWVRNMNTGLLVDNDPDFGVPAAYTELYGIKKPYLTYEIFLAQSCSDYVMITSAGEDALTSAYEWTLSGEDMSLNFRQILLAKDFSFDQISTWSKIPNNFKQSLMNHLLDAFSRFSKPLSEVSQEEWVRLTKEYETEMKSRYNIYTSNEVELIFASSFFYLGLDDIKCDLPQDLFFNSQRTVTGSDISNHFTIENILCLIAIHPSTPTELIEDLEKINSPRIREALSAMKQGLT
jgi:hypothetical protein